MCTFAEYSDGRIAANILCIAQSITITSSRRHFGIRSSCYSKWYRQVFELNASQVKSKAKERNLFFYIYISHKSFFVVSVCESLKIDFRRAHTLIHSRSFHTSEVNHILFFCSLDFQWFISDCDMCAEFFSTSLLLCTKILIRFMAIFSALAKSLLFFLLFSQCLSLTRLFGEANRFSKATYVLSGLVAVVTRQLYGIYQ